MSITALVAGIFCFGYGSLKFFGLFENKGNSNPAPLVTPKENGDFYFRLDQSKNLLVAGAALVALGLIGLFT
jgi:hypothetical protein